MKVLATLATECQRLTYLAGSSLDLRYKVGISLEEIRNTKKYLG